jgi:hypothetical protein
LCREQGERGNKKKKTSKTETSAQALPPWWKNVSAYHWKSKTGQTS